MVKFFQCYKHDVSSEDVSSLDVSCALSQIDEVEEKKFEELRLKIIQRIPELNHHEASEKGRFSYAFAQDESIEIPPPRNIDSIGVSSENKREEMAPAPTECSGMPSNIEDLPVLEKLSALIREQSALIKENEALISTTVNVVKEDENFESADIPPIPVIEYVKGDQCVESTMDHFACHMHEMEVIDKHKLKPKNLIRALERRREMKIENSPSDSENISCLVALSSKHYTSKLTQPLFCKMTREVYIPYIDQEAALQLLIVEAELGYAAEDHNKFSSLQSRCIRSLLSDWDGVRQKFDTEEDYWKALRKLPPSILGMLFVL